MRVDAEEEFTILELEALKRLIIGAGQDHLAVLGERDGLHGRRVRLDNLRVALDGVVPDADGGVVRARDNRVSRRRDCNGVDGACVADEAERPHVGLKVPNHHGLVARSTDHLAQVGVEASRQDAVLVALEGARQCGVSLRTCLVLDSLLIFRLFCGSRVSLHYLYLFKF